ncbi:unnamed protein product [Rotaria sordida]|uniref:Nuclear receptor domain-containing protein n=1 Tax=Rotaria sordida TaxID=392033 RepID=A0A814E0I8_9BILA|nr:unnamed protein product [Rotaria sordida]CAF3933857.1 unnamed protein product [Rotaria sordida]
MCCKIFFRRNALLDLQSLQCRYLLANCIINMKTRRDCLYCRLKQMYSRVNILLRKFKNQISDSTCIRLLLIILLFSIYDTYHGHIGTLCITQGKYIDLL